jgi:hypothetical protein
MKTVQINCCYCNNLYEVTTDKKSGYIYRFNKFGSKYYCSKECRYQSRGFEEPQMVTCLNCNKEFKKHWNQIKKQPNHFCTKSCAATYNNTHKAKGTRKSKLEHFLENKLKELYPTLEFHFTRKDTINSELDIYIPLLNLAFELNGIFHYEPIYGEEKLNQIQNNDDRKFQACLEKKIELCIIDTSRLGYFKESNALPYLKIVQDIIDRKIKTLQIDLNSLPVVVYETNTHLDFIKNCLECGKEFENLLKTKKKFCCEKCRQYNVLKRSKIYKLFEQNKFLIKESIKQNKSMNEIGKLLGYKNFGGNHYILKRIIDIDNFN